MSQGIKDQFVYTCCAAKHLDKECVLFGVRIDDDGTQFAIIGYPIEVPVDEVTTYSRKEAERMRGEHGKDR